MNNKLKIFLLILAGVLFVAPIGVYVYNFHSCPLSDNPTNWGVLGDYFGGILNPIFSLAAFITLFITLKNELKNSRQYKNDRLIDTHVRVIEKISAELDNSIRNASEIWTDRDIDGILSLMDIHNFERFLLFLNRIYNLDSKSPYLLFYVEKYANELNSLYTEGKLDKRSMNIYAKFQRDVVFPTDFVRKFF